MSEYRTQTVIRSHSMPVLDGFAKTLKIKVVKACALTEGQEREDPLQYDSSLDPPNQRHISRSKMNLHV